MPGLPPPLSYLAHAVEPIYRAAIARRNRAFDAGRRVERLPIPVISVGNISLGGTGKTPMVMRIARWLIDAGRRPAIAMRGYGAAAHQPSDEHLLYLERFPGLPIVAQPDRLAGLRPLIASRRIDCVVLDDGFQHRFIARDLDIVLIDATRGLFADRCLPAGTLREPAESLRRAHVIVLTHCESATPDERASVMSGMNALLQSHPITPSPHRPLILQSSHAWTAVPPVRGQAVIALCAVGNPGAFFRMIENAGGVIVHRVVRRDHHRWTRRDIDVVLRLVRGSARPPIILTTEKDWVKLRSLDLDGLEIVRPVLTIDLGEDEPRLRDMVLRAAGR